MKDTDNCGMEQKPADDFQSFALLMGATDRLTALIATSLYQSMRELHEIHELKPRGEFSFVTLFNLVRESWVACSPADDNPQLTISTNGARELLSLATTFLRRFHESQPVGSSFDTGYSIIVIANAFCCDNHFSVKLRPAVDNDVSFETWLSMFNK